MKAVIKSFIYTIIAFCIADTLTTTPTGMQAGIYFCLLIAGIYEAMKMAKKESTN